MSVTAIIPARGGSKGVPGKNLRSIGGVPLLARTIRAALSCQRIGQVVVTSDSEDILALAEREGARGVKRPRDLSGDQASSEAALLHVLELMQEQGEGLPEHLVFLQCTSPFTSAQHIDGTLDLVINEGMDCAFSAVPSHVFLWTLDESGCAVGVNHDSSIRPRRQDRQPEWQETGAVYVMRTAGFLESRHRFFGRIGIAEAPVYTSLEIDSPVDLEIAEVAVRVFEAQDQSPPIGFRPAALVMDFDGVWTDDAVWVDEDGKELVRCSRSDGMGLSFLMESGLPLLVISKERNGVVAARCRKLGIECQQAVDNKLEALGSWAREHGIPLSEIVFVGNDVNDLECLNAVGTGVAVADAHCSVREAAQHVLEKKGGNGALRELAEYLLDSINQ